MQRLTTMRQWCVDVDVVVDDDDEYDDDKDNKDNNAVIKPWWEVIMIADVFVDGNDVVDGERDKGRRNKKEGGRKTEERRRRNSKNKY